MPQAAYDGYAAPGPPAPRVTPDHHTEDFVARSLRLISSVAALAVAGGLVLKGVGEVVSDRFWWSQWLEWAPNVLVWSAALAGMIVSAVAARFWAMATGRPAGRRGGALFVRAVWLLLAAYGVWTVYIDLPVYRRRPESPGSLDRSFRVVFWNAAAEDPPGWESLVSGADGDLVVLGGVQGRTKVNELVALMPEGTSSLVYDRFAVISRRPMKRFAYTSLDIEAGSGLDPRLPEGRRAHYDPGAAMYVEIEGSSPDAPSRVLWILDLPSDLSLSRWSVTLEARAAIDAFQGQRMVRSENGTWAMETDTGYTGRPGFPTPDLIVGDFNIPRGSRSLDHLNMGFPNAFDQAARRYVASWPGRLPLLHIDQAFVGPSLRAWRYEVREVPGAAHLMQCIDITTREAPAQTPAGT